MFSVMDLLTQEDKRLIDSYRWYAPAENNDWDYGSRCSVEYFLRTWAEAKDEYLKNIFKDKLIISEPFEYNISRQELEDEMCALLDADTYREKDHKFECQKDFYEKFCQQLWRASGDFSEKYFYIKTWFDVDALVENKQTIDTFSLTTHEGKVIKFQKGSKVMRNIRKIADLIDAPGFDDFCNAHSQILNQKSIKGTLCLSIHPLDYMTMSDNAEGWESCMSWQDDGCYSTGTLEMMNSKSVVVAYVSSNDRMFYFRDRSNPNGNYDDASWNSKKWRTLVVVDKFAIASIKAYPYQNDSLSSLVVEKLARLMNEKNNVEYNSFIPTAMEYNGGFYFGDPEKASDRFRLGFHTNYMYNDFGCVDHHYLIVSNYFEENYINPDKRGYWNIDYSGTPICVCCGNEEIESECSLVCPECDGSCIYCENCDSRWPEDEMYFFDGQHLCPDCYSDLVVCESIYEDEVWRDETVEIFASSYCKHENIEHYDLRNAYVRKEDLNSDEFLARFGEVEEVNNGYRNRYFVYVENFNDMGWRSFDFWSESSRENYKNRLKGNL